MLIFLSRELKQHQDAVRMIANLLVLKKIVSLPQTSVKGIKITQMHMEL